MPQLKASGLLAELPMRLSFGFGASLASDRNDEGLRQKIAFERIWRLLRLESGRAVFGKCVRSGEQRCKPCKAVGPRSLCSCSLERGGPALHSHAALARQGAAVANLSDENAAKSAALLPQTSGHSLGALPEFRAGVR